MKKIKLLFKFAALAVCMSFLSVNAAEIPYLPIMADINGTVVDLQTFALPTTDFTMDVIATDQTAVTICGIYYYVQGANTARIARRGSNMYLYNGNTYVEILIKDDGVTQTTGITGATSATILAGTAYAPNIVLGSEDVWDVSFTVLTNPNFSTNASGWTSTTKAQNIQRQTNAGIEVPGVLEGGFYENWNPSAFTGKMYTTAKNFPFTGKYTLTMGVRVNTEFNGAYLYAAENEVLISGIAPTATLQTLNFTLVGSQVEIGLNIKEALNNWVSLDNVKLLYSGTATNTELKTELNKKIAIAQAYLTEKMQNTVHAKLTSRIADANAATEAQAINDAADSIRTVLVEVKASMDEYLKLKNAIQAATDSVDHKPGLPGESAVRAAIADAQSQYNNATLDATGVEALIKTLESALKTWLLTQEAPFDAGFMFKNISFESSISTEWVNDGFSRVNNGNFPLADGAGKYFMEKWTGSGSVEAPGALANAKITQTVNNLPNGKYTITVAAHALQQNAELTYTKGAILFANGKEISVEEGDVEATDYVVNAVVTEGTLSFGFKLVNTDANWVALDNFRIYYAGFDVTLAIDALKDQIQTASSYTSQDMEDVVLANLNTAINSANTIAFNTPEDQLTEEIIANAASGLTAAMNAAKESIDAYLSFLVEIGTAEALAASMPTNPNYDDFMAIIDDMYDLYDTFSLDVDEITEQIDILAKAMSDFRFKQITPFDATFMVLNPSFEGNTYNAKPEGFNGNLTLPEKWTIESDFGAGWTDVIVPSTVTDNPVDGAKFFNAWAANFISVDIYQEITLPAGKYELSASMRTEKLEEVANQRIYASVINTDTVYSEVIQYYTTSHTEEEIEGKTWRDFWELLTLKFELPTSSLVRIGALSTSDGSSTKGWFQLDNFKLTCLEVTEVSSVDNVSVEKPIFAFNVQGGIIINGNIGKRVNIYSVAGQLIKTQLVDGSIILLNQGMYIVSVENATQKVVVK